MKIIQLIPSMGMGGAETLVKDYAIGFSELDNIECTVVTMGKMATVTANELQLQAHNINEIHVTDCISTGKFNLRVSLKKIKALRAYCKKSSVDVVHVHLSSLPYLFVATPYLKKAKLFYTIHNEPKFIFGNIFRNKVTKLLTKRLIQKNNLRLIGLHEDMRVELNAMFHVDNTAVINNGIDMERFNPALYVDGRNDMRGTLGFAPDDFVVGHVGRFAQQKNHAYMLDVFERLAAVEPKARLLLIGSGPLKAQIMERIQSSTYANRVVVLENRKDIPELLSVMDVFLFPSLFEGLSVTLVETQAMGLKCVVSDTVSPATHLTDRYIPLSLQDSVDTWCDTVLDASIRTKPERDLSAFHMKEIVKTLAQLYRDS